MFCKIRCQNESRDREGKPIKCNHIVLSIPDWLMVVLKDMEGHKEACVRYFCHWCKGSKCNEIRFVNGKLAFRTVKLQDDIGKEAKFEDVQACSEATLTQEGYTEGVINGKVK